MAAHWDIETPCSVRSQITVDLVARTGLDEAIPARPMPGFYDRMRGEPQLDPIFAGQSAPLIETLPTATELIVTIRGQAAAARARPHKEEEH